VAFKKSQKDKPDACLLCFGCVMHPNVLKSKKMEVMKIKLYLDAHSLGEFIGALKR
jgi:hypothetical protein